MLLGDFYARIGKSVYVDEYLFSSSRNLMGSVDSVRLENVLLAACQLGSRLQSTRGPSIVIYTVASAYNAIFRLYNVAACVPQLHYTSSLHGSSNLTVQVLVCRSRERSNGRTRKLFISHTWGWQAVHLICENCFCVMLGNTNPRKCCASKIFRRLAATMKIKLPEFF